MMISHTQTAVRKPADAFTLMEVVISVLILTMVMAGLIYGYAQINRSVEWNSLALVGQSYASDYAEQARGAQWNSQQYPAAAGPGPGDQLYAPTNYIRVDTNYSATGQWQVITSAVSVVSLTTNNINLRQIRVDSWWRFPLTGTLFTNTVITQRAPDQ